MVPVPSLGTDNDDLVCTTDRSPSPAEGHPVSPIPDPEEPSSDGKPDINPTTTTEPVCNRKRPSFSIDNIMGCDSTTKDISPPTKKQKNSIFDSIPSPPPKITDIQPTHALPGMPSQFYNSFLLNIAATRNAVIPTGIRPPLNLMPLMPPFLSHPALPGFPTSGQSVL